MDFSFSEEQELLRANVRKLMDRHAPPDYVARCDRDKTYP
jgi:alkylation response protein AidB-like acyl-CoA dehydrogenase